jgi:hypothetical protein
MQLALIPPYAHLRETADPYHLLLPQCFTNYDYHLKVLEHRTNGDYMILDNGAAEDIFTSVHQLHNLADQYKVSEIVVHDKMCDATGTIKAVKLFRLNAQPDKYKYMGVIQGRRFEDCLAMIEFYLEQNWITCIGIPRHLLKLSSTIRTALANEIRRRDGEIDIHLLGTSPDYILELRDCGSAFRDLQVRGVDTSAPFNYALDNQWIGDGGIVLRPKNYFSKVIRHHAPLASNIVTMTGWVHG